MNKYISYKLTLFNLKIFSALIFNNQSLNIQDY